MNDWKTRSSILTALILFAIPAFSQSVERDSFVIPAAKHDVSLPLWQMAKHAVPTQQRTEMLEPKRKHYVSAGAVDPGVQREFLPDVSTTNLLSFDAMTASVSGGAIPPDTNGSVGSTQFVEIVNVAFEVFDKATGNVVLGATPITAIWSGFGGPCESSPGGDPVVLWDKAAQRWLVTELAFSFTDDFQCVAVSTTSDATGGYYRYAFNEGPNLTDYPKYSVWTDAYYTTANIYSTNAFLGARPCALDRASMLSGGNANAICFPPNPENYGFLPSDFDGTTAPPVGAPAHYVDLGNMTNELTEYDFHVDFTNPKNSTFTGPNNISVPNFVLLCDDGNVFACIPQPSPGEKVDSLSGLLMHRLAYRNFGDHEAMVVAHSVQPGAGSTATSANRWYELRATPPGSAFKLYQSGTYQHPTISLWMASIAMDKKGDIAMGMSATNPTNVKPSIAYTGRAPNDPLGKMEAPSVVVVGNAVQVNGGNRWGDYSSMSIDPADDCTFWYAQEYYNKVNGGSSSNDWTTHITSFRFNSCN
ncbi:MAG TPA: hypothetical protein VMB18_14230 [Terriglobales bacterium]|nr:hypothetical protein [Terriglobales bacterium]